MNRKYYTLVASLPYLPRGGQIGERIPINKAQMKKRFKMLDEEDQKVVAQAWKFIVWEEQNPRQSDEDVVRAYYELAKESTHPALLEMMRYRMSLRTVVAALRRRIHGEQSPPNLSWGVEPWNLTIQRNWAAPDFGLSGVFPWIDQLREDMEYGQSKRAEETVMNLVWDSLDRLCLTKSFSLEHVLSFVFKWDILERWLAQDSGQAQETIEALTDKLVDDFRTQQREKLTA